MFNLCIVSFFLGFIQTNIAIIPASLATTFGKFAEANAGPIPLVHTSKVGEYACPEISADSDIRTDLPLYSVFKHGECIGSAESLIGIT